MKVSTTKIVLNGDSSDKVEAPAVVEADVSVPLTNGNLDEVQGEFYKHGKQEAEELVKKIVTNSDDEHLESAAPEVAAVEQQQQQQQPAAEPVAAN